MAKLAEADWQVAASHLRKVSLLQPEQADRPATLDSHALVRQYFAEKLKADNPTAWKEGPSRLYDYYKNLPKKELPVTIDEMEPLYAAVNHGCNAERYEEALGIYSQRMHRGSEGYSQFVLGAISADLAAVRCFFFDRQLEQPVNVLSDASKGHVLNEAGWDLRVLGRLRESIQPMQAAVNVRRESKDFVLAANSSCNLTLTLILLGDLDPQALDSAREGVELADLCPDAKGPWGPQQSYNRAFLANALHMTGRLDKAEAVFRKAEEIQGRLQPEHGLLYAALVGFLYCDLLLDQGRYADVKKHASQTLDWNMEEGRLRDIGLDRVALGRAYLLESSDLNQAAEYLQQAVSELRSAEDHLCLGLLARAQLHVKTEDYKQARTDLEESLTLSTRMGARLHQADTYLGFTRLHLEQGNLHEARPPLEKARQIVQKTKYHRRDGEIEELEQELARGHWGRLTRWGSRKLAKARRGRSSRYKAWRTP